MVSKKGGNESLACLREKIPQGNGNGVRRLQIHDGLTSKLSADFLGVLVIFRADKLST